jgi:hypothetical protein
VSQKYWEENPGCWRPQQLLQEHVGCTSSWDASESVHTAGCQVSPKPCRKHPLSAEVLGTVHWLIWDLCGIAISLLQGLLLQTQTYLQFVTFRDDLPGIVPCPWEGSHLSYIDFHLVLMCFVLMLPCFLCPLGQAMYVSVYISQQKCLSFLSALYLFLSSRQHNMN